MRDEVGVIYEDETFAPLFKSTRGRPAESPGCLALVSALQEIRDHPEGMSIAWRTANRAKEEMGIVSRRQSDT